MRVDDSAKEKPRKLAYSFESAVLIHENLVFHQIDLWEAFLINVTSDPAKITGQVLVLFVN